MCSRHPSLGRRSAWYVDRHITDGASFDITSVFNGLRPVLKELSPPESLNQLTRSVIAVIEGDGTGIGPAMDSIGQLSEYATDRQVVVSTLIRNLSIISEQLGGRSPQAIVLLTQLANLFDELQRKVEGVVDFALTAPAVMAPLDSLLANLGLTPESNPDLDELVRTVFPNPAAAVDSLRRLPRGAPVTRHAGCDRRDRSRPRMQSRASGVADAASGLDLGGAASGGVPVMVRRLRERRSRESQAGFTERRELRRGLLGVSVVVALLGAAGLFSVLPVGKHTYTAFATEAQSIAVGDGG